MYIYSDIRIFMYIYIQYVCLKGRKAAWDIHHDHLRVTQATIVLIARMTLRVELVPTGVARERREARHISLYTRLYIYIISMI